MPKVRAVDEMDETELHAELFRFWRRASSVTWDANSSRSITRIANSNTISNQVALSLLPNSCSQRGNAWEHALSLTEWRSLVPVGNGIRSLVHDRGRQPPRNRLPPLPRPSLQRQTQRIADRIKLRPAVLQQCIEPWP